MRRGRSPRQADQPVAAHAGGHVLLGQRSRCRDRTGHAVDSRSVTVVPCPSADATVTLAPSNGIRGLTAGTAYWYRRRGGNEDSWTYTGSPRTARGSTPGRVGLDRGLTPAGSGRSDRQIEREISDVLEALAFHHHPEKLDGVWMSHFSNGIHEFRQSEVVDGVDVAGAEGKGRES